MSMFMFKLQIEIIKTKIYFQSGISEIAYYEIDVKVLV